MTELGSTSLQIAFLTEDTPSAENNIAELQLQNGMKLNLYEYSYLCYGEAEIFRRIQAQLVKVSVGVFTLFLDFLLSYIISNSKHFCFLRNM